MLSLLVPLTLHSPALSAGEGDLPRCGSEGNEVASVGVPGRYDDEIDSARGYEVSRNTCIVFTRGNDYELLEWLENSTIDGAILSEASLELLKGSVPEGKYEYSEFQPLSLRKLDSFRFAVRVAQDGAWVTNPIAALHDSFAKDAETPIYVPSHLSSGFFYLLSHMSRWLNESDNPLTKGQRDAFWDTFFTRIRFGLGREPDLGENQALAEVVPREETDANRPCEAEGTACLQGSAQDYFVIHKRPRNSGFRLRVDPFRAMGGRTDGFTHWLQGMHIDPDRESNLALKRFLDRNYGILHVGSRTRRDFQFTIDELWEFLERRQVNEPDKGLALVLTGGGVKAAYQSRLLDYLYDNDYLTNVGDSRESVPVHPYATLPVDYVIGTSGGALLGVFVSALRKEMGESLSDALWVLRDPANPKRAPSFITSADIFPLIDMLRYLSLLVCGGVLGLFMLYIAEQRTDSGKGPARSRNSSGGQIAGWDREDVPWLLLLIISPWVIKVANGAQALEHVPYLAGVFYVFYMCVFLYSDNRLYSVTRLRFSSINFSRGAIVALVAGLVMIAVPLMIGDDWIGYRLFENTRFDVTVRQLLVYSGFLVLAVTYFRILAAQTGNIRQVPAKYIRRSAAIVVLVLALGYLLLIAGHFAFDIPILELTIDFWVYLAASALIVSVLFLAYIGGWGFFPRAGWRVRSGVAFLVTKHPKKARFVSNRYMRFLCSFTVAWLWWNFVSAPSLYGNMDARDYFYRVFAQFVCKQKEDYQACMTETELRTKPNIEFNTTLVISATALEQNTERYFLFPRLSDDANRILDERTMLAIDSDPRWVTLKTPVDDEDIRTIAFASGSPFPVFPAHHVKFPGDARSEWLVDGGYAHNIPIEAAAMLEASRILVVRATPVDEPQPGKTSDAFTDITIGKLWTNLPRLIPYFYNRSQVEDLESTGDIMVASISPSGKEDGSWPLLTDFQEPVVKDMFHEADSDRGKRVGRIESWGVPMCRLNLITAGCNTVLDLEVARGATE